MRLQNDTSNSKTVRPQDEDHKTITVRPRDHKTMYYKCDTIDLL